MMFSTELASGFCPTTALKHLFLIIIVIFPAMLLYECSIKFKFIGPFYNPGAIVRLYVHYYYESL